MSWDSDLQEHLGLTPYLTPTALVVNHPVPTPLKKFQFLSPLICLVLGGPEPTRLFVLPPDWDEKHQCAFAWKQTIPETGHKRVTAGISMQRMRAYE